ncbi:MAG TPA: DUF2868 domain-containing protein [Polyangiaceae bacterium]|nr:DUF2868 domain-containing protein [Polyangiaceae bacterium]
MAFSRLGQVLDIEWLLERDEGRDGDELARHDRQLLGQRSLAEKRLAKSGPVDAEQALALWLEGRRAELDQRTLGVRVSELLTAVHGVLFVLAVAGGVGTAEALLAGPSSREPTNVLHFVFATLVWPLGLLAGSLLLLIGRGRLGRSVLLEDGYLLLLGAAGRLAARRSGDGGDLAREWRRLRRSARRYRDIEVGSLIAAAQWYPLGFHLGAAGSLAASALFSDLAFAWSTTDGSLSASTVATTFGALTAPWCRGLGVACVSPELVQATQFSRFTGQYAAPDGALVSGAWWAPLCVALLVYGVVPRLLLGLGIGRVVAQRATRLSERVLELRGRLRAGTEVVASPAAAIVGVDPAPPLVERVAAGLSVRECWVIRWRGAPVGDGEVRALCERLGLSAVRHDLAGGSDFESDRALLDAAGPSDRAALLVVEGWEAPDKATRRFVRAVRERGAADRPIFVAVLVESPDAAELGVWRDRLRLLEDPFVSVQALVTSRAASGSELAR